MKWPTILNLKFDNSFPYKDYNLVCKPDDMELQMNLNWIVESAKMNKTKPADKVSN